MLASMHDELNVIIKKHRLDPLQVVRLLSMVYHGLYACAKTKVSREDDYERIKITTFRKILCYLIPNYETAVGAFHGVQLDCGTLDSPIADGIFLNRFFDRSKYAQFAVYSSDFRKTGKYKWQKTYPHHLAHGSRATFRYVNLASGVKPGWGEVKPWFSGTVSAAMRHNVFLLGLVDDFKANREKHIESFLNVALDSPSGNLHMEQSCCLWELGAGTLTPPGFWYNVLFEELSRLSMSEDVVIRYLAFFCSVLFDASIVTWKLKYMYDLVRPVTVLNEETANLSGRLSEYDTEEKILWKPFLPTPQFPAFPSGHSVFSSCAAELIRSFKLPGNFLYSLKIVNHSRWPKYLNGLSVSWTDPGQMAVEAGHSRVIGGVHWAIDNEAGALVGKAIAKYAMQYWRDF